MYYFGIIMGGILFLIGWLAYKNPNLIAGYSFLTEEEKRRYNERKFPLFMFRSLSKMAFLAIIIPPLLGLFGYENYAILIVTFMIVIGSLYIVFRSQSYQKK